MKRITHLFILAFIAVPVMIPAQAHAGECYEDPEISKNLSATVTTGANVRDGQCMEGTTVITTLQVDTQVTIIGEVHGWYHVKTSDGTTGWVGQWLLSVDGEATETKEETAEAETTKEDSVTVQAPIYDDLQDRVRGHILLQVEDLGKAWYVNPTDGARYYMKDGATAYEMMRAFGLGISEADFGQLEWDYVMRTRLAGKIVLRVEKLGEAYWVHPTELSLNYLKDGDAAYELMRLKSLGITDNDLSKITSKEFEPVPYDETDSVAKETTEEETSDSQEKASETTDYAAIQISDMQGGEIPSGIDLITLNEYWTSEVNDLRAERGLRQLDLDQRWVDTASEYAQYMYENQAFGHERDGGLSMHQWIDTKDLEFTERYSEDGWNDNYFTENISWGITDGTNEGVKSVLNYSMDFFLGEVDWNGPHYRTIYHADWNTVGVGFYFEPLDSGSYKVYIVMHYGSLAK